MKMEHTECSETSAYKIQTPGNYPEKSIQYSEHCKSLKSRNLFLFMVVLRCYNDSLFTVMYFSGITQKNKSHNLMTYDVTKIVVQSHGFLNVRSLNK